MAFLVISLNVTRLKRARSFLFLASSSQRCHAMASTLASGQARERRSLRIPPRSSARRRFSSSAARPRRSARSCSRCPRSGPCWASRGCDHRGLHHIVAAEVFINGLRFGRRFDDDQVFFAHVWMRTRRLPGNCLIKRLISRRSKVAKTSADVKPLCRIDRIEVGLLRRRSQQALLLDIGKLDRIRAVSGAAGRVDFGNRSSNSASTSSASSTSFAPLLMRRWQPSTAASRRGRAPRTPAGPDPTPCSP